MRDKCKIEVLPKINSRCHGAYSVDCGVTMVNQYSFLSSTSSTSASYQLVPGKLIIDTSKTPFYKEKFKVTCYTSTLPTVNIIEISNICDELIKPYHINDLGNPLGLSDTQYVDILDLGPGISRTEYVLNTYQSSLAPCRI
jgi:hypothetical protein